MAPHRPDVNWEQAYKYLPVTDIIKSVDGPKGIYDELIRRKPNDSEWYKGGLYHDNLSFKTPSMWFVTWYDISTGPNLATFNHVRKTAPKEIAANQFLVIAPTLHCRYELAKEKTIVGQRNIGDARLDYKGLIYGWFDYWLKGKKNNIIKTTPRFDRNLNIGGNNFDENKWIVAHNTIHHSIKYPSHIKFPVMIRTENK